MKLKEGSPKAVLLCSPVQTLVNCIIVLDKGCIPFGNILQQPDIGSKTLLVSLRLSVYVDALRYGQQHG